MYWNVFTAGFATTTHNKGCAVLPKQLYDFPFRVRNKPVGIFYNSPNYQGHSFHCCSLKQNGRLEYLPFVRITAVLTVKSEHKPHSKVNQRLSDDKVRTWYFASFKYFFNYVHLMFHTKKSSQTVSQDVPGARKRNYRWISHSWWFCLLSLGSMSVNVCTAELYWSAELRVGLRCTLLAGEQEVYILA